MDTLEQTLLNTLKELRAEEFNEFKFHLRECVRALKDPDFKVIPACDLENADRQRTVQLICQNYKKQPVQLTQEALTRIHRNDLVKDLSEHVSTGPPQFNSANMM